MEFVATRFDGHDLDRAALRIARDDVRQMTTQCAGLIVATRISIQ